MFRQCIARALDDHRDLQVTAQASSLLEARRIFSNDRFDLMILDVNLSDGSGLDLAREVHSRCPLLVLSGSLDDRTVTEALEAGAQGYVPKSASLDDLIRAVRAVLSGSPFLHPLIGGAVLRNLRTDRKALSVRERSILAALSRGEDTSSIAVELNLSASTVKTYLSRLYQKLSVNNRAQAVSRAQECGLLSGRSFQV